MLQICADALGVPVAAFDYVMGDTDLTPDAGKTSASRQAFVSGRAAKLAGEDLRGQILRARQYRPGRGYRNRGRGRQSCATEMPCGISIWPAMPADEHGHVLTGSGTFDPPTRPNWTTTARASPMRATGSPRSSPRPRSIVELGTVRLRRIVAAHDVGKAINPTQVEGQVHGGIAQGIGLALMEEYVPGVSENLHDYLIPTVGDVPEIECITDRRCDALGPVRRQRASASRRLSRPRRPSWARSITRPARASLKRVPATPDRVLAAIRAAAEE